MSEALVLRKLSSYQTVLPLPVWLSAFHPSLPPSPLPLVFVSQQSSRNRSCVGFQVHGIKCAGIHRLLSVELRVLFGI